MVDLKENKYLLLEGTFEDGQFIIWEACKAKEDAIKSMHKKLKKGNKKYLVATVEYLSDEYEPSFKDECIRELEKQEKIIEKAQEEIADLKQKMERYGK